MFQLEIQREGPENSFGLTLSKETDKKDACKTIFIETIIPNSPASIAGFQKGDVIASLNGQKVESLKHAAKLIKGRNRSSAFKKLYDVYGFYIGLRQRRLIMST